MVSLKTHTDLTDSFSLQATVLTKPHCKNSEGVDKSLRSVCENHPILFITLHGFPTAILFSGISFTTTEPAPITEPSPIVTPLRMILWLRLAHGL